MKEKRIDKRSIHAPQLLNEASEYGVSFTRGMRVELGDCILLEISGTASVDENGQTFMPGDFAAQVKRTYDNITALLKSEGADWHDVVKTRCYLKNMEYYDEFNKYRNAFYKEQELDPLPASVGIAVELCRPELLVEIEATAILKK